ncbi:N-acetylneuraminate synthase [Otoolea muris]|uniref:N-acetylneuraminate synthase n=1 Tax=Otoolea muris TaxID=2941515 RepID=UPI001364DCFE|nr:N-acetylneuraminate synthase [Otoolea muris]
MTTRREHKKIFIIAEAGVNHNGSIERAEQMIYAAKEAGADAVKFQTFRTECMISRFAPKAEYQKARTGREENQRDMVKKLELSFDAFRFLKRAADKAGILFLSTPFELESICFLESLGMPLWKIPSGEITNLPYLERIAATKKPILLSTGMCEMDEIRNAVRLFENYGLGKEMLTLLHCTTEYPTPEEDVNLRVIPEFQREFGTDVGYSDHTLGIEIPIAAAALGANVIEKHFTLDKALEGPDHRASLDADELAEMVKAVRKTEAALGDGIKKPSECERQNRIAARKSIVAMTRIRRGEVLTEQNITVKRPGNGISPMKWYEVLGTTAERDYEKDERIESGGER